MLCYYLIVLGVMFHVKPVSIEVMNKLLKSLDPHGSCGYDNIPATFLIKCADQLAYPLTKIFNLSIERGEYPSILKFNNVIPIYKQKGEKTVLIRIMGYLYSQ